jgi:tetratricopeptide (TPR) repeat protein
MSQRLTRKEIKRDQVQEALTGVMEFLRQNLRILVVIAGGVLLVIAAVAAFWSYRESREIEASELLAKAIGTYSAPISGDSDPATGREGLPVYSDPMSRDAEARTQLELVVSDFGSSDAAAVAKAYLGEMAARSGDLDGARQLWEEFLKSQGDHMLASEVRLNLMSVDRAQGREQELVTQIKAMLEGPETVLPEDVLLYQLALTQEELGLEPEARQTLQRLVNEHPQSVYAAEAQSELGTGLAGNPLTGL